MSQLTLSDLADTITAQDLIDRFLEFLKREVAYGKSEQGTLVYYQGQLEKLRPILPADLLATAIRPHHLHKGPVTWHFLQATKRVWSWAADVGLIEVEPLRRVKLPPAGRRERILTEEERAALFGECQPYFRELLWFSWRMAARPIEVRTLLWKDVDIGQRVAWIEDFKGKRRRKNKKLAMRAIVLDAEVINKLTVMKQFRQPRTGDPVFTNRHGERYSKDAVCRAFARACDRAGIDQSRERAVPYTLRHTKATEYTADGMGQKELSEVMGHADMRTTERYQHLQVNHLVDAVDRAYEREQRRVS